VRRWLELLVEPEQTPHMQTQSVLSNEKRLSELKSQVDYLVYEVQRQGSLIRYLAADSIHNMPIKSYTKDSFEYQWRDMPDGNWVETRPELKEREPGLAIQYTGFDRTWFDGKHVLDAGCGSGRWTWALASLGACVTALDQSEAGVYHTRRACAEFGDAVQVFQHDLLNPLPFDRQFDLVWSYGVLHHTGNTYGVFQNIARHVKLGGYLFIMIYGAPRPAHADEFAYYAEVARLRQMTRNKSFQERLALMREFKADDDPGGWFDAVSPEINDLYTYDEIEGWLLAAGFTDIQRTAPTCNHLIIARRSETGA
jgi:SAM-dependent methyltransferase